MLKKVILLSMLSMVYTHTTFGRNNGNTVFQKALKKLNIDTTPLVPDTDYNTYELPNLQPRSILKEAYDDEPILIEEKNIIYKRNSINITEIANKFMKENYPNLEYIVTDILNFPDTNFASIHMAQAINDIAILNTAININVDKITGKIISTGVSIWNNIIPSSNAVSDGPPISLKEAIVIANDELELIKEPINLDAIQIQRDEIIDNKFKVTGVPYAADGSLSARKLYTAVSENEAERIWELTVNIDIDLVILCVSIDSGTIVQIQDLTNHASYRVVPINMPNIGNSSRETYIDPFLREYSPLGWHNDDDETYTDTRGNNCIVVENSDGDDKFNDGKPVSGGIRLKFEFSYNADKKTVEENQKAAASNVFYIINLLHDIYYKLGFTEGYGNFQYTNFSGEGQGKDPVVVVVSDRKMTNNAQMIVDVDGIAPILRLYPFTKNDLERDPAFDNQIIIHEFTHGVSNRLTGGPSTISCLTKEESNALNEGFSDFFANALQFKTKNNRYTPVHLFEYVMENARKYPITSDMNVNPLKYSDLSHSKDDEDFVYNGCEIWSVMLHEVFWNVVDTYKKNENFFKKDQQRLNYAPSNFVVMKVIINGMKLQPCNPTFISARDAILAAVDSYINDNKFKCLFWVGFAKRGLGMWASEKSTTNNYFTYKNDYTIPEECEPYKNF